VKDFNVSLRGKNGHFVGISQATPRVSFGGPIGEGKVNFSEVFEYDVRRDPVRGLAWPNNEIKSQGFNSFTRVQAILSPQHVFNADVNVFPMRTEFANITALVPQTASSPGLLLAVDAQPDGTVARKRYWRGNFLFAVDPALGGAGRLRSSPAESVCRSGPASCGCCRCCFGSRGRKLCWCAHRFAVDRGLRAGKQPAAKYLSRAHN